MLSRERFDALLRHAGVDPAEISLYGRFEAARDAAEVVSASLPGIGFLSVTGRMNGFLAACRHLDQLVWEGCITEDEAQLAIIVLRFSDSKFKKAVTMFDVRGARARAAERSDMPNSARRYLADMQFTDN